MYVERGDLYFRLFALMPANAATIAAVVFETAVVEAGPADPEPKPSRRRDRPGLADSHAATTFDRPREDEGRDSAPGWQIVRGERDDPTRCGTSRPDESD